ncbi:MAG: DUF3472 domain-containing protein [Planctomycetota bacterium]|nr:DUF3472 domain-containing protein [Planctomycetota bacterium]
MNLRLISVEFYKSSSRIFLPGILILLVVLGRCSGQDSAPSSHMVFNDGFDGDLIINQVRVPKQGDALYTYYEALGWRGRGAGYAGIQSHPRAKNFIFSIWDHKDHASPIRAVYYGPGTETKGFGGEGTGLKSWNFELGWKTDIWYTLVARSWPVADHTYFGFWVQAADTGKWTHLVTMDVAVPGARFRGSTDAFIEDWLNTGKNRRVTHLKGGWKRDLQGKWHAFQNARYSVNSWDLEQGKRSFNFRRNWDGGVASDPSDPKERYYYMISGGGETRPTAENPSRHSVRQTGTFPEFSPIRLVKAWKRQEKGKLLIEWKVDPRSAPQFAYEVITGEGTQQKTLRRGVLPQARSLELEGKYASEGVRLRLIDLFDRPSAVVQVGQE